MLSRRIRSFALVAAVAVPVVGCGSDKVSGVDLSQAQVEDMLEALSAVGMDAAPAIAIQAMNGGNVAPFTLTLDDTSPCPNGGTTRVQGSITFSNTLDGGTYTGNVTQGYTNCAATSSQNVVWTFNGNPHVQQTISGSHTISTGNFSATLTQQGAINFSSGAGSGGCSINLNMSLTGNELRRTMQMTMSGTACGRTINRTLTL